MADCLHHFLAFISQSIAYVALFFFFFLVRDKKLPRFPVIYRSCRCTVQPSTGAVNGSCYLFTQHTVLKYQRIFPEDARHQLCLCIESTALHVSYSPAVTPQQLSPREGHVTTPVAAISEQCLWQQARSPLAQSLPALTRSEVAGTPMRP